MQASSLPDEQTLVRLVVAKRQSTVARCSQDRTCLTPCRRVGRLVCHRQPNAKERRFHGPDVAENPGTARAVPMRP